MEKSLYVNRDSTFSEEMMRRLEVHEVQTHMYRAANSYRQRYKSFVLGMANYEDTEEGLAVFNEEKAGLFFDFVKKSIAARLLAVNLALKEPFSSIHQKLLQYFTPEEAFNITLRAKRGLEDTSQPGGLMKDHIYLEGYWKVKEHLEERPEDYQRLYTAKIGLQDLGKLDRLHLRPPEFLPDF